MSAFAVDWRWSRIEDMSGAEVHDLLKLRQDVFVVEQACAFPEIDGRDGEALHLRAFRAGTLAGALRVMPADATRGARIGRIATASGFRGGGLGHQLMGEALRLCSECWPEAAIDLSAQAHLETFYRGHGFVTISGAYLEDGIPHLDMRRAPAA
ncbi:GNAT family N-acetyltransferase [Aureimonas sp. AU22]|uniref:GNAT family N-acetyltransferase n=1 Tax=Aureimonas sp. AU22 TaxID=1638162 RepID=UPI000AEECE26|nr:GNAT family N-acetyltransferase [Aureimonas sp. AU22]